MKKDIGHNNFSELRERARKFLTANPEKVEMTLEDTQKLVHELNTYQIELELQNEDLRNTLRQKTHTLQESRLCIIGYRLKHTPMVIKTRLNSSFQGQQIE